MRGWRRTRYEFFSSPSVPPSHPWTRWVKRQVHYAQLDPWKTRWDNKSICSRRWLPISELSLASFLKRVPVLILSYDYKFLFTYKLNLFSYEWLSTKASSWNRAQRCLRNGRLSKRKQLPIHLRLIICGRSRASIGWVRLSWKQLNFTKWFCVGSVLFTW